MHYYNKSSAQSCAITFSVLLEIFHVLKSWTSFTFPIQLSYAGKVYRHPMSSNTTKFTGLPAAHQMKTCQHRG